MPTLDKAADPAKNSTPSKLPYQVSLHNISNHNPKINHSQNQVLSRNEPFRPFSTSLLRPAANASPQKSYPAAPIISPKSEPPSKNVDFKPHTTNPALKLAKEVRKRATGITETYIAYGVTETLVKECARQADYSIPQASEKGVKIPTTMEGEDLGVGTGWWYEGT